MIREKDNEINSLLIESKVTKLIEKNNKLLDTMNKLQVLTDKNNELENIDLSTDFEIYKTFEPIYHKSQKLSNYNKFVHFALFPFMPLLIILGVIGKFSYYLFSRNFS